MIHVCHVRDMPKEPDERHVYCGRKYGKFPPSPLGNPFLLTLGRVLAISNYQVHLANCIYDASNGSLCKEFNRLLSITRTGDLYLYCWCAPQPCHCDVIKAELEARL